MSVRGVLQVHSAPPALCPHIEWAIAGVLDVPVSLPWVEQPASPGALRAELAWQGRPGASGAITSALAGWNRLRFEVTEEASPGCDPVRYSYTPALGTFCAAVSASGDVMICEGRLRAVLALSHAASSRAASGHAAAGHAAAGHAAPGQATVGGKAEHAGPDGGDLRGDSDLLGSLLDLHEPRHPALGGSLEAELELLLGQPWDDELEPFRRAAAGAPVRWLNATG